jgi:hypothetical protein
MRLLRAKRCLILGGSRAPEREGRQSRRDPFEGKVISVKIDLPGTSKGIDVYPEQPLPVNFRSVADNIKEYGTALRIGDKVMISKVAVKGNTHIEFQLGGGGFGTFWDSPGTSSVSSVTEGESKEEKALKVSIRAETNAAKKKQLERELSSLRSARERENARARATVEQANAAHEANLRVRRAEGGSRFNVRFRTGIPASALTATGLAQTLSQFVDFSGHVELAAATSQPAGAATASAGLSALRKGLLLKEVEDLLGPATTAAESAEGSLTVLRRSYAKDGMKISTMFVQGVLIDFTIAPQ